MTTKVTVYTMTHSVTYVADNVLKSLKDILVLSGLDPSSLVGDWASTMRAMTTWLESRHLKQVVLEIYNPNSDTLITRWDVDIVYGSSGENRFWTDTDQLRYAIQKSGILPAGARYRVLMDNEPGYPVVPGWGPATYRSTAGMVRQSLGSTVEHNGLGGSASYWRKGA